MSKKKVIIIGGGLGGIALAALLAKAGRQVAVYEQNKWLGGKVHQLKSNGFTFDLGPSFITGREIYHDYFANLGLNVSDYLSFQPLNPTSEFRYNGQPILKLDTNWQSVKEQLQNFSQHDQKGFEQFLKIGESLYQVMYHGPKLARRNYNSLLDYFDLAIIKSLPALRLHQSWSSLVQKLFTNPALQAIFSYQASFLGMTPEKALAAYAFLTYLELKDGLYTLPGGVYTLINQLVVIAKNLGVDFYTESKVDQLLINDGVATGIHTQGQTLLADTVVVNMDAIRFYQTLMPSRWRGKWTNNYLTSREYTGSFFTISLGLQKPVDSLGYHTISFGQKMTENYRLAFQPQSLDRFNFNNFSYYVTQPSLVDANLAPKGQATLFVLAPVYAFDTAQYWQKQTTKFKQFIYRTMKERDGIDLKPLIVEEHVFNPVYWQNTFNLYGSAVLGLSHNFLQVNTLRLPNKSREVENLYFVGGSTVPGAGLPSVITSAELTAERILS